MARSRALVTLCAAAAALLVLSTGASAQRRRGGQAAQPTAAQREAARTAYARGQELFRAGTFAEAEAQFNAAYAAIPNPIVLLSVAECQERQSRAADAVATLQRYLTERADAPDRAQIEQRITALQARPGTLAVTSTPSGAAIAIDGQPTGRTTPSDVEVPPGEHSVVLTLAGYEAATQQATVTYGARAEVTATLTESPQSGPSEDDVFGGPSGGEGGEGAGEGGGEGEGEGEGGAPPPPAESPGVGLPVWISAGVGGAALIAGTVLGFLALDKQAEFNAMPSHAAMDDGETLALFADVSFGVAAAGIITAIVLYATSDAAESDERAPADDAGAGDEGGEGEPQARRPRRTRGTDLVVAPVVAPSAGGVSAMVRF